MPSNLCNTPYIADNFFFIDSTNCRDVQSRMYGYAYMEDEFNINYRGRNTKIPFDTYGCYINIIRDNSTVYIQQDYFGLFGLFIYERDGYFAISNSLFLMLIRLNGKEELDIDYSYLDLLVCSWLVPPAIEATYIKQISHVPSNVVLSIDTQTRTISRTINPYNIGIYPADSEKAFEILDHWQEKYKSLYVALEENDYPVKIDISGGFDSRTALATIKGESFNYEYPVFYSADDALYTHKEDFELASELASRLGFKLNQFRNFSSYPIAAEQSLIFSMLPKFLYHSEPYYPLKYYNRPYFNFGGQGGENLRVFYKDEREDIIRDIVRMPQFNYYDFNVSARDLLERELDQAEELLQCDYSVGKKLYFLSRTRNHFGKTFVESFLANKMEIAPLMDPNLYKIDQHLPGCTPLLLNAIIIGRYLPELVDIPFQGGRSIPDADWQKAHELNSRFPRKNGKAHDVFIICLNRCNPERGDGKTSAYDLARQGCHEEGLYKFIAGTYGDDVLTFCRRHRKNNAFMPDRFFTMFYQIRQLFQLLDRVPPEPASKNSELPHAELSNNIFKILMLLLSSRVDLKFIGNGKDQRAVLTDSIPDYLEYYYPDWLADIHGRGLVIQTRAWRDEIRFRFCCPHSGTMDIYFRAPYMDDVNGKRVELCVNYKKIIIKKLNHGNIWTLHRHACATHDEPVRAKLAVDAGDCFEIRFAYAPCPLPVDEYLAMITRIQEKLAAQTRVDDVN